MSAKKKNKNSTLKDQGPTSSLSPTMISSNNNNNNSSSSLPSTSLSYEILLDQNKMLHEDIRRLQDENEYLKKNLMSKSTGDETGFSLQIPRLIMHKSNENWSTNEEEQKQAEKKRKMKKKKIKQIRRFARILGLTYRELKNSKQNRITSTCRKIVKMMYPTRELLAEQHISSISSKKIRAIQLLVKLYHPKQKDTPNFILNNAMGNVFSTARR